MKNELNRLTQRDDDTIPTLHDHVSAFVPGKIAEWNATGSGTLNELTFGIKDVFDIAGTPTGYGNPQWEDTHPVPTEDAPVVSTLRQHGADIVGKTITDELAFSLAGNNFHYGSPTNSAAPDRLTGGSSCGSAAAVAADLCDVGLGTDTAGSIRAPASFCGVYGIRPTHGLISSQGVCHLAPSFDTVGWLTNNVRTLAAVGDVLLPASLRRDDLKGWMSFDAAWSCLPDNTQDLSRLLFRDLQGHLGQGRSLPLELADLDDLVIAFRTIQFFEVWNELGSWVERTQPVLGPDVLERMTLASKVTRSEYEAASEVRALFKARMNTLLEDGQVIVMPTVSGPAPLRTASIAELNSQRMLDLRFLSIAPLAGLPQISLPLLSTASAPLGLSIIGAAGSDKSLLAFAENLSRTHVR